MGMEPNCTYQYNLDLLQHLRQTAKQLSEQNLDLGEIERMHQNFSKLFLHFKECTKELKPRYTVDDKLLGQITVELEYLTSQIKHQSSYKKGEVEANCKKVMEGISSKLEGEIVYEPRQRTDPFLVNLWTIILQVLERISVFDVIRRYIAPKQTSGNYRFVDYWLVLHTFLAVIYVVIAGIEQVPSWIKYTLLVYSCLRMFEILVYQLNVILVHPYNTKNYSLNSYRRMTIALLHNFFEIIFWFAGTFITLQFITNASVPLAVYTSFTHMVTYSMDLDESKWSMMAIFILQFQAVIGVFMTVLSLARFISLFPQPASMDPLEQEANEQRHEYLLQQIAKVEQQVTKNTEAIVENRTNISVSKDDQKYEDYQEILQQLADIQNLLGNIGNTGQKLNAPQEENTAIK